MTDEPTDTDGESIDSPTDENPVGGRSDDLADGGPDDRADETEWPTDADEGTVRDRIRELSRRAQEDWREFEPPTDPPDEERAMRYLRDGAGQAIALYIHARTGGRFVHLDTEEFAALEDAMNDWLSLYARCYGVELDASASIRTAAETLLDTEDVRAVAVVLTGVPER